MRLIAALMLVLGMAGAAAASANADLGPALGSPVPAIGTPLDSAGTPRTMASLTGEKGVVLVFYRSAAWCPYCQAQLIEINDGLGEIEKRGYTVAGISYDDPATGAAFSRKRGIGYPLVSDPKSEIIDRFGVRDPQYPPGSMAHGVPRPIILVLDPQGVVLAKLYEESVAKRPPVGLIVETLDGLAAR
ncbi:peroxiredoxin family protein [Emcibacter sp. SYSU 3D8]|uniref:peroxiredoxin family protein n=1 Tax=Emcibacter sp. SYSU 3D8 TaxID=3133969 RepID=UPI0031FEA4B4